MTDHPKKDIPDYQWKPAYQGRWEPPDPDHMRIALEAVDFGIDYVRRKYSRAIVSEAMPAIRAYRRANYYAIESLRRYVEEIDRD